MKTINIDCLSDLNSQMKRNVDDIFTESFDYKLSFSFGDISMVVYIRQIYSNI